VKRRRFYKAVVRRIPAFMTAQQFHAGFTDKLDIKYHSLEFKHNVYNG